MLHLHPVDTCEPTHFCFPKGGLPGAIKLTQTCLPQGFKTPQLSLKLPWHLICEHTWQRKFTAPSCNMQMTSFLQQLTTSTVLKAQNFYSISYGWLGTKYPRKKAQICQDQFKYLGFYISQDHQSLGTEQKQVICSIPTPTMRIQICEFLGAGGFCQIWILISHC
jgi:hypothetical protein